MRFDELFSEFMDYPPSAGEGGHDALRADAAGSWPDLPPLDQEGRRKGYFPGGGGVYLLTDAQDRFIQLAAAADLRRALTHRLADTDPGKTSPFEGGSLSGPPVTRRRANLREIVRRIRWRPAHSLFEITYEYYRLARLLMPDHYLKQVGFGPCWFVHVDPEAAAPRFQTGKLLRSPPGVDLGPFATQADAGRFIEILEDAFDLCRYYSVLQQAPRGQACAYFDMGKCPAPCNGSITMAAYAEKVGQALSFARGDREAVFRGWEFAMRAAAARQAYEQAGAMKQHIERARRIEHESFRLIRPVEAFRFLIVQRGGGTTQVKPFFVRAGCIDSAPAVRLKSLADAVPGWVEQVNAKPPVEAEPHRQSEHIWLVSHFLFKREPAGLFLLGESLGPAALLVEQIRDYFTTRKKEELRDLGGDPTVAATEKPPASGPTAGGQAGDPPGGGSPLEPI